MSKKIYFLINSLEWGGAERVVVNITRELAQNNDISIITLKDINFYELPDGIRYIPLSHTKSNITMALLIPWYIIKLKKVLKEEKFDDGISSLEIANFINILVNKNAKIAFEISITFFQGFSWFLYKFFIKLLYPLSKKIKVNSEENKYDLAKFLVIDESKIVVIYNPIDGEMVEEKRKESIEDNLKEKLQWKKVFITVWRLVWQKYHRKLIDSFKKIYDEIDKNWMYIIVGDGPEMHELEKQIISLGLENNIILMWAKKNVFKYLNISNYFVYASKIEWFPNVLGEAMACNLPIITSDFKTWARECIEWNYNINIRKNIKYPYFWSNGVLLDLNKYDNQFFEIYKSLNTLKQEKKNFERFDIKKVSQDILDLFQ